jgi:hypothetical protein
MFWPPISEVGSYVGRCAFFYFKRFQKNYFFYCKNIIRILKKNISQP